MTHQEFDNKCKNIDNDKLRESKNDCFDYTIMGQISKIYSDVNIVYEDGYL